MNLPKSNNPIYKEFFSRSNIEANVEKTEWKGEPSNNSFCFINPKVKYRQRIIEVQNTLREVFGISSDIFNQKYIMAISGDGQEVKRISTLHSSSLAALLLLYSISRNKELICKLENKDYTFHSSYFEVKTNVKGKHFSNMDVVLIGKNSDDKDVIFFLESKFSEYLNTGMCNNISLDAYKQKYLDLGLINNDKAIPGLHFVIGTGKDKQECLQIKSDTPQYCSGIKQMISHYIGVTNYIIEGEKALDPDQKRKPYYEILVNLQKSGAEIILGEILFSFDKDVDQINNNGETKLSSYSCIYSELAKILNDKSSKLHVLSNVLTYQELLNGFELDDKVKAFYQLK